MPDPTAPRKLSRWPLYIAFGLAFLLVVAWSGFWLWARGQAESRLEAGVSQLKAAGYEVGWKSQAIGGYPFRLNVTLTDPRIRDRSGWALEAPRLEAQAFLHAPTHWLVATPDGLTFVRPQGGPVRVQGKLIRASLSHLQNTPPNLSFEGVDLVFQPAAGANPFALERAQRVEFHLRQAPSALDEGGVWLTVKDGKARLSGLLGRIAGEKPISIEWDGRLTKMSAFRGADWPTAVRNWDRAGGRMSVKRAGLTAGDALIGANAGSLGVDSDGRLTGSLDVSLRQAPRAIGALGDTGTIPRETAVAAAAVAGARETGDLARMTLYFQAGQTTLGPVAIARAPKVYETR
ncbi:MAG: DUF2125 domain-containing protein [Phenylobacterium sp.]|uniref:DUF2125 domain-containing protein n=1 Tax=Phenylobacterium sp. TaxID=1871053 RepID=UPI001A404783|nr:DUF2125 domain-containing protein [Phenylobacterium sp.]MBL8773364.1 DUF2125 domain-containing protein [Phenylobacterium sp.]